MVGRTIKSQLRWETTQLSSLLSSRIEQIIKYDENNNEDTSEMGGTIQVDTKNG